MIIKEVLEPTFSICDNPKWSLKTGKFVGNYADYGDVVIHFSPESFYLWMTKADLDDFDIVAGKYGLLAEFIFGGKRHHIDEHRLPVEFNWEEIEKCREKLAYQDGFGPMLQKLFSSLRPGD